MAEHQDPADSIRAGPSSGDVPRPAEHVRDQTPGNLDSDMAGNERETIAPPSLHEEVLTDENSETAPNEASASVAQAKNVQWPRLARLDYQTEPNPTVVPRASSGNPFQRWTWIALQVCGFGLLLGGYFLGQAWAPNRRVAVATDSAPKAGISGTHTQRAGGERALEAASRALQAERAHNFPAAQAIYDEMTKRQTPLVGAEYRLALIARYQGDIGQTEKHLNSSLRAKELVGECYLFRASLAGMKGNYADASIQLAAAVRAEPFNAKLMFCWGESLRRDSRLSDAIQRLSQALDRPDNIAARELYLFKLRLAKIEAGNDELFDAELTEQLANASPAGDWLVLAAARDIVLKNYAAAADQLQSAKSRLPLEIFRTYLRDYLFQGQRDRLELAAAFNIPLSASGNSQGAPLEDPAVWTAAEADPATWPPFAKAE